MSANIVSYAVPSSARVIPLGRQGENEALQIVFDLWQFIDTYGAGTATLVHMRSGDSAPYICNTVQDGGTLTWTITNVDTAFAGPGKCELRWVVGETLAKSIIYATTVDPSITGAEEIPSQYESWMDALAKRMESLAISGADITPNHTGAYIKTNVAVGGEVDLTPLEYAGFDCAVVPCEEGDTFTLTGTSGNSGRLWAFLDEENLLISKSGNVAYMEGEILTAPAGSAKLVLNFNSAYPYAVYKGNRMTLDRNIKKHAIPQVHLNVMDGVAMPSLAYHSTIQQTAGVSGAKTAIFKSGDRFCVTYGENLDGNAGDYPRVTDSGVLAMKYKFFQFANEAESNVSYGTFAQKGSAYTDYTGATKTFVGGCGLPSGRQGKQFFTSAYTGEHRYNGFDGYGMTPCVCDVSVSDSGVIFGAIRELRLVIDGVSGKFDLTRIDPENVDYNLYLTTAPPIKYNNLWHWIQPGKHSLIYLTSPDAVTWTHKWTLPTDFDPCCEVSTVIFRGHILAAVRTWGSNEIKFTSSTLHLLYINTGGYIMHQYSLPNVSTRSYLVNSGTDALLFYNNYSKTDAECVRITSTGADGLFFHRWFAIREKGSWYITCNEDTVAEKDFSDMYLAGGNDAGPSQANGMEFIHLTFDPATPHSPEDVEITVMGDTISATVDRLKRAAAWDHSDTVKLTTSLTDYIEAHELGTFYAWSPTQNATDVGAPTTNSYHYEITKTNAATVIIIAYRMTAGGTQSIYVKQKYGDTWGGWTATGGGGSSAVTSVNGKTGAVVLGAGDVGAISTNDLQTAVNAALATAKASGEFDGADGAKGDKGDKGDTGASGSDGADGKSAYQYARDAGYTGTEAQFAAKLAAEGVSSVNGQTGVVVISNATTSAAGLMSATDKSHLDDVYADYSSALTALGVI